ncbi:hypothetical protein HPB49_002914 [Dermacentor silvarum]|uniref:Uncharacterized protein n=1 Tax=Dermacentor silvarum TaxID=543639 RepID=A0ACB8DT43_DERSI|nr:hypothetical protein HPB49_002914 [Dermacentor silvarum]
MSLTVITYTAKWIAVMQIQCMRDDDLDFFFKCCRMKPGIFDLLLSYVMEDLTRRLVIREPIAPAERLAIALRHTIFIVLMAAVDSEYKYILIDVGAEGRKSDGGVLKNSEFGKAL